MNTSEAKICELIDSKRDELISLARDLVRIDSCNPYGPLESVTIDEPIEKGVGQLLHETLSSYSLAPSFQAKLLERPNVICEVGTGTSSSLILNGHMDTVPIGDQSLWTKSPLKGEIVDGKLYGRGAYDMKGSLASMVFSTLALAEIEFPGKLIFAATVDEEPGAYSTLGAQFVLEQGLRADACIVTEPGNEEIKIGSKGLCRLILKSRGVAEHTGRRAWEERSRGANAVTNLARMLVALEELHLPSNNSELFRGRRNVITPGTFVKGGHGINIVPEYAEASVDMRLLPGVSAEIVCDAIDSLLEKFRHDYPNMDIRYEVTMFIPASLIDEDEPIVAATKASAEMILGHSVPVGIAGGASDHHFFLAKGIPAISDFGPQGANAHAPDEYVEIESLVEMAKIYALTALKFSLSS